MNAGGLRARRAAAQLLHRPGGATPEGIVRRLLAVQAQDAHASRLALRARGEGLTASGAATSPATGPPPSRPRRLGWACRCATPAPASARSASSWRSSTGACSTSRTADPTRPRTGAAATRLRSLPLGVEWFAGPPRAARQVVAEVADVARFEGLTPA